MTWIDAISDIVDRCSGAAGGTASAPRTHTTTTATWRRRPHPQLMADALAHTFRSEQTPNFPEKVSSRFRRSSPDQ